MIHLNTNEAKQTLSAWETQLGDNFNKLRPYLMPTKHNTATWPCECGQLRSIKHYKNETIGVCESELDDCDHLELTSDDIKLHKINIVTIFEQLTDNLKSIPIEFEEAKLLCEHSRTYSVAHYQNNEKPLTVMLSLMPLNLTLEKFTNWQKQYDVYFIFTLGEMPKRFKDTMPCSVAYHNITSILLESHDTVHTEVDIITSKLESRLTNQIVKKVKKTRGMTRFNKMLIFILHLHHQKFKNRSLLGSQEIWKIFDNHTYLDHIPANWIKERNNETLSFYAINGNVSTVKLSSLDKNKYYSAYKKAFQNGSTDMLFKQYDPIISEITQHEA